MTQEMRRWVIDSGVRQLKGPRVEGLIDPRESERLVREAPFAEALGTIHAIFVSLADHVPWAVDAIAPGDKEWTAVGIRRDGSILGTLRGAVAKGIPVAFRAGRVTLLHQDADGVSRVGVFPVVDERK